MNPTLVRAAVLILCSELLFTIGNAAIKTVSASQPLEMIVFFRNIFGLGLLVPMILRNGVSSLRTKVPHMHLMRGLVGVSGMYCFFYAFSHLPLAEATTFKLTSPLFIPIIAFLWLKERIPKLAIAAVIIGFAGVLLILRPGTGAMSTASLIGLLGALFAADAFVTVRRMTATEPGTRIVFYFTVIALLVSAVPLLWAWKTPTLAELAWMCVVGGCATGAQLLFTRAYALAPAGQIGPLTYVSVVYGALFGWLFWDELLGVLTVTGIALVVLAGILTIYAKPEAAK